MEDKAGLGCFDGPSTGACQDTVKDMVTWGKPAFCVKPSVKYLKTITIGDINAFLFLFFDNFSSLIAILGEMIFIPNIVLNFKPGFVQINPTENSYIVQNYLDAQQEMVFQKVVPGIGFALLFGNIWYAVMAAKLATSENRADVTALPYGINTPAGFLTVFMVMLPILFDNNPATINISPTDFADKCFKGACAANFIGGLFEVSGLWLGEFLRRNIPRAALFGPVCGVGFVWLGFNPLIDVMREPIIGLIPLFMTFIAFFANGGKGWYTQKVPFALIIMVIGTVLWWCGLARHDTEKRELNDNLKMQKVLEDASDRLAGKNNMLAFVTLEGFNFMKSNAVAVQFPIALQSFIETIENVEMAALKGDSFNVKEAMLADGCGTMFGALFGATIPTTVYIGHTRHKVAGARYFYSLLNGIVYFLLCTSGFIPILFYLIDPVAISCILIAVGLMIVQLAIEKSATRHIPCVCIGIMFLLADMLYFDHFDATVRVSTRSIGRMKGVMNMAPAGGIICSLIVPAILCDLIDGRFFRASVFCAIACFFSMLGLMHGANYIQPDGMMIPAMGADESDYYTTDLGEVTFSLHRKATYESWQTDFLKSIGVGDIPDYTLEYKVDDQSFDDPYRCPPWMQTSSGSDEPAPLNKHNLPCPEPAMQKTAYNEGWRFGIAYGVGCVFCLLHGLGVKYMFKGVVPIMDNGAAETMGSPSVKIEADKDSSVA